MVHIDRRALLLDGLFYLVSLGVAFIVALLVAFVLFLCGASAGLVLAAMATGAVIGLALARRATRGGARVLPGTRHPTALERPEISPAAILISWVDTVDRLTRHVRKTV
ncbi:MAG: hypothetical protein OJF48_003414 [Afipia sp.]|jgi:H+/Cl- antiporter ClcA|nr:MAG: hypothetical protein OJF48_003414 [Afipia sp.]